MATRYITAVKDSARARLGSEIVIADGWGFLWGMLPIDLENDRVPLPEMVEAQTRKVLANLDALLTKFGFGKENVVSVHIAMVDFERLYERMNSAYVGFFAPDALPARSCAGVAHLPRSALVAMDFVLRVPEN